MKPRAMRRAWRRDMKRRRNKPAPSWETETLANAAGCRHGEVSTMQTKRTEATLQTPDQDHAWLGEVHVTLPSAFGGIHAYITRAELQGLVQQAYEQHGILAQPWTAEPPSCNGTGHCVSDAHSAGCITGGRQLEAAR